MIYGFRHQGGFQQPEWAGRLTGLYWFIRVEGRDKAKRRRYYRYVAKEKLRLAEQGIDQELIRRVCRYLAGLNPNNGQQMHSLMIKPPQQLTFDFK